LVVSLPVAVALTPIVVIRRLFRPVTLHILKTESDYGHLVGLLEFARKTLGDSRNCIIVVEARYPHKTFKSLYQAVMRPRMLWSHEIEGILAQALLLFPAVLVRRVIHHKHHADAAGHTHQPLVVPQEFVKLRKELFDSLGLNGSPLVLLSVHTREYDQVRTPGSGQKDWILETRGAELGDAVDFLQLQGVNVVRVGGRDSGGSHIPRSLIRIEDFSEMGSSYEVALASECTYFWNDEDGGWWTSAPFHKPVLCTNVARFQVTQSFYPSYYLYIPALFERLDGVRLTFREMLEMIISGKAPYKAAVRGELRLIRNSPREVMDGNREMLARIDGTWRESAQARSIRKRMEQIWHDFPSLEVPSISESFLLNHPYLLDDR
jgi:putative glycosyltransferase (TIGR04372 family)